MSAQLMGKPDKIGELWSELQKTEERLRTVGGGVSAPVLDCFVTEQPKDPFDATVFTTLSDADLRSRIGAAQSTVASMVAAVVADIDGQPGAQLSPLFARGRAQLMPMGAIEGPHSQWIAANPKSAAAPQPVKPAEMLAEKAKTHAGSQREQLARTAAEAKVRTVDRAPQLAEPVRDTAAVPNAVRSTGLESSSDALSAGSFYPQAHAPAVMPKRGLGGIVSSTDALTIGDAPLAEPLTIDPNAGAQMFENKAVPEPRAHRDLPSAVHADHKTKIKPIKKKRPLWLRILWG